ncbi:MAG: hypothetical protein NZ703_01135 [Gemmataceae bacterium]|nr:hypothetical protein [Gemmataceae bacterium]MCS7269662.1 hypothetical protein [Gemmataceae bacterium]MDW8244031.1 hypothetical protein [Thermogemmata sp.]
MVPTTATAASADTTSTTTLSERRVVPLSALAHGRSGDKGNHANIAILAYTEAGYTFLCDYLTAERVAQYFAALRPSRVERYEAPNVRGLNFVLYDVLGGGASGSLRSDSQGKALAMALLRMPIPLPEQVNNTSSQ